MAGVIVTDLREAKRQQVLEEFFDKYGRIPTPHCGLCSYGKDLSKNGLKRVDKMSVDYSFFMNAITFTVECHGQSETVVVPRETLPGISGFHITEVFKHKGELFKGQVLVDHAKAMRGKRPKSESAEYPEAPSLPIDHPEFTPS